MPVATWEAEIGRIVVQGQPRQIVHEIPISKIIRTKWTAGMAQVVECLVRKGKGLNSNRPPQKKTKQTKCSFLD
jgi:hypothetical protein